MRHGRDSFKNKNWNKIKCHYGSIVSENNLKYFSFHRYVGCFSSTQIHKWIMAHWFFWQKHAFCLLFRRNLDIHPLESVIMGHKLLLLSYTSHLRELVETFLSVLTSPLTSSFISSKYTEWVLINSRDEQNTIFWGRRANRSSGFIIPESKFSYDS